MLKKNLRISLVGLLLFVFAGKMPVNAATEVGPRILYDEMEHYELIEAVYRNIVSGYPDANQALDALLKTAIESEKQKEYEQAKNAYQQIIQQYPHTPLVSRAQLDLTRMDILSRLKSGDDAAAETAVDKLLTDFSGNEHIAEAIHHTAYRYRVLGKYEKANRLDRYVMGNWPASDYALWAQMDMAETNIDLGDEASAEAEIDKLVARFRTHPRIAEAVHHVAFHYQQLKKYKKAQQLDEYVIAHWPKSDFALWAQMDIAEFNIERGDDTAGDTAIAKLLSDFSGHPRIAEAVHHTAYHCRQLRKYEKANQLDRYVMENWPDTNYALWAQMDIARTHIERGEQAAAEVAIDKLITDFAGHPNLAEVVLDIGYSYYTKARLTNLEGDIEGGKVFYRKAIEVWERLIREFPDSEIVPNAYYSSAVCYAQELEEYQKGIDYFQKVVNNWPDYEYAQQAQLLIVEYYNKMENNKNEK